jgi:phosphopantetheine adenylyltransferase/dephospho-CoA kinase
LITGIDNCLKYKNIQTIRRVMRRDGVSEEEAIRRIESQMSNMERVQKADVVLSSLWEPEETQRQVLRTGP